MHKQEAEEQIGDTFDGIKDGEELVLGNAVKQADRWPLPQRDRDPNHQDDHDQVRVCVLPAHPADDEGLAPSQQCKTDKAGDTNRDLIGEKEGFPQAHIVFRAFLTTKNRREDAENRGH